MARKIVEGVYESNAEESNILDNINSNDVREIKDDCKNDKKCHFEAEFE